ncbi:PTS sugar transporter subunit IIB [Salmonella enterica]|uniref:PTS system N,N'-diacetylchitobiose-specific transporter subunit IIB n=10 Tax=Salmonella enterica TaxID=28901 RepID=A0A3S4K3M9_SALER|nr:PTS sugar transporter subunit IIB [Salmonella enterica]EBE3717626.1 PTS sugar transporter subunit IIB [Salmonella enterica subsp. diarizonae serovar 42:l,v:1,5,7]EBH8061407.1 PTS sugar transporter subunit IIB [Salmonella bongori]EBH9876321.1 PTS sugar transporter subunit IIB [Salmonella enterica subsp. enterica serovar 6,7:-1,5]EBT7753864.1 PTS sugar transporter subunit IIB [Salmonella enterica subsp. diarizonae serovar 61:k:1,5,7]EBV2370867.1 PTS sugar transporter subunit IIB [Salmonella e
MKNILLVCAAGMSTSMLVKRMCEYAATINAEVNINALAIAEAKNKIKNNEADIVLLGPQVRFQKSEIEGVAQGRIPVAVIDMKDYGAMNGKSVLEFAFKLLEQQYNQ